MNEEFYLIQTATHLELHSPHQIPFYIDFNSPNFRHRLRCATKKNELVARAMGKGNQTVIDATAGLGRDSFILGALGFQVLMIERSPILFALLNDALQRAATDPLLAPTISRLNLRLADSLLILPTLPQADVIYLDPMFPARKKEAKVKKDLQLLQVLLAQEKDDSEAMLALALTCAGKRVVVKRPRLALPIKGASPAFSYSGESSRFDIYLS